MWTYLLGAAIQPCKVCNLGKSLRQQVLNHNEMWPLSGVLPLFTCVPMVVIHFSGDREEAARALGRRMMRQCAVAAWLSRGATG